MMAAMITGCGAKEEAAEAPAAAAEETAEAESDLAYVKEKGVLVVGITDFAPMDYKNEDGEWIGFDADMAKFFAGELGVDVEFVEIDWDNKILELDAKSIDCVFNLLSDIITPPIRIHYIINAVNWQYLVKFGQRPSEAAALPL